MSEQWQRDLATFLALVGMVCIAVGLFLLLVDLFTRGD